MKPVVLVLLIATAFVRAEHLASHVRDFSQQPWKRFTESLGAPHWEKAGSFNFTYINPNEMMGHLIEPCLEEGGAFISVGTLRGLNIAGAGKVKQLVMLDYDEAVNLFNMATLQILQMSKDRYEFVTMLMTGERNPALSDEARSRKKPLREFFDQLVKPYSEKVDKNRYELNIKSNTGVELGPKWRKLGVRLPSEEDWKKLSAMSGNETMEWHLYNDRKLPYQMKEWEKLGGLKETILGDDKRFETVKKMAVEGRITIAQGDISSPTLLKAVGDSLKQKGLKVTGFDVSNIPGYMAKGIDPALEPENAKKRKRVLENFKGLPLSTRAKMFATSHNHSGPSKDWFYFSVDHRDQKGLDLLFGPEGQRGSSNDEMAPSYASHFKHDSADSSKYPQLFSSPSFPCGK